MIETKFRGQRKDNNEFITGDLCKGMSGMPCIMPEAFFATRDLGENDRISKSMAIGGFYPVIQETVGQYTGLNDKNGVEIYEGDVLDVNEKVSMIFEVYYQDGGFRYGTKDRSVDISFSGHNFLKSILSRFIIIGNIHENPELLNTKS